MGIGFVLLGCLVGLLIGASIGSVLLLKFAARMVGPSAPQRKHVRRLAALLPFACIAFAGGWFVVYAVVNDAVFHRDPGFGDTWYAQLPNGYALGAIDVLDSGEIYNPAFGDLNQSGAIDGVTRLQVSGKQIFGARDKEFFSHFGKRLLEDEFFSLDTTTGRKTVWRSEADLNTQILSQNNREPNLRAFSVVFSENRSAWFDVVAALVGILVPAMTIIAYVRWLFVIRNRSHDPTTA